MAQAGILAHGIEEDSQDGLGAVVTGPGSPLLRQRKLSYSLPGSSDECPPPWLPRFLHRRRYFLALGWSPHSALLQGISHLPVLDGSSLSDPYRRPAMWFLNIAPLTRQVCSWWTLTTQRTLPSTLEFASLSELLALEPDCLQVQTGPAS